MHLKIEALSIVICAFVFFLLVGCLVYHYYMFGKLKDMSNQEKA